MADDGFYSRLHEAEGAGLNKEWALKVAYLEITLAEALGGMDHRSESESVMNSADKFRHLHLLNVSGDGCDCRGSNSCPECIPF